MSMSVTADDVRAEFGNLTQRVRDSQAVSEARCQPVSCDSGAPDTLPDPGPVPEAVRELLALAEAVHHARDGGKAPWLDSVVGEVHALSNAAKVAFDELGTECRSLQEVVTQARVALAEDAMGMLEATPAAVRRTLAHAHKLSYSSFAPLLGNHLLGAGPFQPPFPTAHHMQMAKLQSFAQAQAASEANAAMAARAAPKAEETSEQAAPVSEVARPILDGQDMPPMPPGWKPGDPIPLPPGWPGVSIDVSTGAAAGARTASEADGVPGPEGGGLEVEMDLDTGIDDDFLLTAEAVASGSSSGSEEGEEDEESGDDF